MQCVFYKQNQDLRKIWETFNPEDSTWIISDLNTKFALQEKLIQKYGFYEESSVLRISELWLKLFHQTHFELRTMQDPMALLLTQKFIEDHYGLLALSENATTTLLEYVHHLSPLLFHPEGHEQIMNWFTNYPQAEQRWKIWYLRSRLLFRHFIDEKKLISNKWMVSFLQNEAAEDYRWPKNLIIDLGSNVTKVEIDLLLKISKPEQLTFLIPDPVYFKNFKKLRKIFEASGLVDFKKYEKTLEQNSPETETETETEIETETLDFHEPQFLKFSSELGEVKHSVSKIRQWLDQGIPLNQIGVFSTDIETYWPVLSEYLDEEGILYNKEKSTRLQAYAPISSWISLLKSKLQKVDMSTLELPYYQSNEKTINYESFKSLYKNTYDFEDISRSEKIEGFLNQSVFSLSANKEVTFNTFLKEALGLWHGDVEDMVSGLVAELMSNLDTELVLKSSQWVQYLEMIISTKEKKLQEAQTEGLIVANVTSARAYELKYRIFLGLSEEGLKTTLKCQLSSDDYFNLENDLGFFLQDPDQKKQVFDLEMLMKDQLKDLYCFSLTDLQGQTLTTSGFWISGYLKYNLGIQGHEELQHPSLTRWDEVRESKERRGFEPLIQRIQMDHGKIELPPIKWPAPPSISPSSLENYLNCPFVFAAQKFFNLQDMPEVDLNVDPRTRGTLAHALFEKLTEEPLKLDWSELEIENLLEIVKKQENLTFADASIWHIIRKRYLLITQRFLDFESNYRIMFSDVKTAFREKEFKFNLKFEESKDKFLDFEIKGKVDRIDQCRGKYLVIDYKSSQSTLKSPSSWFKYNQIQLLFYMWALEESDPEFFKNKIAGAEYLFFKKLKRTKGLLSTEGIDLFYPSPQRKGQCVEVSEFRQYIEQFKTLLFETLKKISSGDIAPLPKDEKQCENCKWRTLCRAPHLN